jgi:hypothetical protein
MVGYRGWTRHGVTQDTAATYTERFPMAFGINLLRDKRDEKTYCLTEECSRDLKCCLTKRAPVASLMPSRSCFF